MMNHLHIPTTPNDEMAIRRMMQSIGCYTVG